ncbi:MAG: cytochrome c biogenesis protein ResB [bacterium]
MWQAPWGYPESFVIILGLIIIGLSLQVTIGGFNFYLLAQPINYVMCGVVAMLSIIIGLSVKRSSMARWIVGVPLTVALILALLALTLIMGIIPQMPYSSTILGFDSMTSNWAFVIIYSLVVLVLGAIVVNRLRIFRLSDIAFYFNHIGLYIVLLASGIGYADMERYIMYVNEGETQWCVYDNDKNIKELPIAITLNDFNAEYYPSKPIYFDVETGEIQRGNPSKYEGNEQYRMVMSEPDPKRFSSDVEVYTKDGLDISATIEVNKPLKVGSWIIYQYGYDSRAGSQSSYSSFELVYDRWLMPVYIGIVMMMLGSVIMILTGHNSKESAKNSSKKV